MIVLEDRLDPILLWQVDGTPADEAAEQLIKELAGGRYLSVIDARWAGLPSATLLRQIAAASGLGMALVVSEPSLRRAMVHLGPWRSLPVPHVLCPHMAAAMLWAEGQLLRIAA